MHIIPGYCINLYIFVSRAFMTDVYCNLSHCNTFYCNTGWICKCTDQCLYVYPAFKTISPTFKAVFRFPHCLVLQSLFWTNWSTPTDFFGEATLLLSRISSIIFVLSLLSWLNVYFLHRSNFKWQTHESLDRKTTNATFPPNFTENHSRLTILAHKESQNRIGKSFPHLSSPSMSIFI